MPVQVESIQESRAATYSISGTSPSSATTAVIGSVVTGLEKYRSIQILATVAGATGGALDLYLQTSPDHGTHFVDYIHFAQITAAAAAVTLAIEVSCDQQSNAVASASAAGAPAIVTVGTGLNPALAASTIIGGEFGDRMRLVGTGGVGTSAGATQTIKLICKS